MAVAFTREEDYESQAADLPDRPVSPHPNLVTATGLAAIERELAAARAAYSDAQAQGGVSTDRTAMARATRDLRYWSARRASAQLIEPTEPDGRVRFGGGATIERDDGRLIGTQRSAMVAMPLVLPIGNSRMIKRTLPRSM